MKKKLLYYTLLVVIFIILLAIDVSILVLCNLVENRFLVAFGAIVVLSLFAFFKKLIKEWVDKIDWSGKGKENESDDTNKTPLMARFLNWNVRHYISLNTVILIVQIVFLYILPVDFHVYDHFYEVSVSTGALVEYDNLMFFFYSIFILAAVGFVINWGHNFIKKDKPWLYVLNMLVQVSISMMYIFAYTKCHSEAWGFLFFPIFCSIYVCFISNKLMKGFKTD